MCMKILTIALSIICCISFCLPPEIPSSAYQYPVRRPMRYSYFRMNSKADFNPLISHIANPPMFCSSKLGPFCSDINGKQFQEFALSVQDLSEEQKKAYSIEKAYLIYRRKVAQDI